MGRLPEALRGWLMEAFLKAPLFRGLRSTQKNPKLGGPPHGCRSPSFLPLRLRASAKAIILSIPFYCPDSSRHTPYAVRRCATVQLCNASLHVASPLGRGAPCEVHGLSSFPLLTIVVNRLTPQGGSVAFPHLPGSVIVHRAQWLPGQQHVYLSVVKEPGLRGAPGSLSARAGSD